VDQTVKLLVKKEGIKKGGIKSARFSFGFNIRQGVQPKKTSTTPAIKHTIENSRSFLNNEAGCEKRPSE
jgi:hypothetical protein